MSWKAYCRPLHNYEISVIKWKRGIFIQVEENIVVGIKARWSIDRFHLEENTSNELERQLTIP